MADDSSNEVEAEVEAVCVPAPVTPVCVAISSASEATSPSRSESSVDLGELSTLFYSTGTKNKKRWRVDSKSPTSAMDTSPSDRAKKKRLTSAPVTASHSDPVGASELKALAEAVETEVAPPPKELIKKKLDKKKNGAPRRLRKTGQKEEIDRFGETDLDTPPGRCRDRAPS